MLCLSRSQLPGTLPRVSTTHVFHHSNCSHSFCLLLNHPFRDEARLSSPRRLFFPFCSVFTYSSFGATAWLIIMPYGVWVWARGGSFVNDSPFSHDLESHGDGERGGEKHKIARHADARDIYSGAKSCDDYTS